MRLTTLTLLALATALQGCALFKLAATKASHPDLNGELIVPALSGEVTITRDDYGVPHIRANTPIDAITALGFVHGQDRLFQADLQRRLAWGNLAPWLGERVLPLDRMMRGLRLREQTESRLASLDPELKAMLQAYADGLNAGAASLKKLPIEYRLLNSAFEPWTIEDSMASPYLQSWRLSDNLEAETFALMFREKLTTAHIDDLFRLSGEGLPTEAEWDALRQADIAPFSAGFKALTGALGGLAQMSEASNNWVVGPSKSADGKPIVANDPHLSQSVPSLWYVADIQGGDLHMAGATLPGVPLVVIGHNERVAWGLTNVMTDSMDLAVVQKTGDASVVVHGVEEELTAYEVEAGGVKETVYWTSLGPVVSTLDGERVVVLRWDALEVEDNVVPNFWGLNNASSVGEALGHFADRPMSIAQNLAIGDVDGDFAWQQVGGVVTREGFSGRVPYDASEGPGRWTGHQAELPGERAHERGYVYNANAKPDHPLATFGAFNVPPARHHRLGELLAEGDQFTPEDMNRIQNDRRAGLAAAELAMVIDDVRGSTEGAEAVLNVLRDWDLQMEVDSAGAAAWALFQRELHREMVTPVVGEAGAASYLSISGSSRCLLAGNYTPWLTDRQAMVDRAAAAAWTTLSELMGDDPSTWSWGAIHPLRLTHPFSAQSSLLSGWNMPEVPWAGDGNTLNAANYTWTSDDMPVTGMASLRIVMPLGNLNASTLVHPGGQSGQPGHRHYRSHYGPFIAGETVPLWFSDEDVQANAATQLTLMPSAGN